MPDTHMTICFDQHREILTRVQDALACARTGQADKTSACCDRLLRAVRDHVELESATVLRVLETQAGDSGDHVTRPLHRDHACIIARIEQLVAPDCPFDAPEIVRELHKINHFLKSHFEREETCLYSVCGALLAAKTTS